MLSQKILSTAADRIRHKLLRSQNFSVSFHLTELTKHDNSTNYTIQWSQTDGDNSLTYAQRLILQETPWQDTFDPHRLSNSLDTTG